MKAEKIEYNFLMTKDDMMHMIVSMNQVNFLMEVWKRKEEFLNPEDKSVAGTKFHIIGLFLIYVFKGE